MKNHKGVLLKILKWGFFGIFIYWLLTTIIMGHTKLDSRKGMVRYGWSGLDALFSDEEFGFSKNKRLKTKLNGLDGPYIFNETKFKVSSENKLIRENFDRNKPIKIWVDNMDRDSFKLVLKKEYRQEMDTYELPDKLIAISDIEGNFNAFQSFLINNGVIDENYNWTYEKGHLVLNGDFFDRGTNVPQVLWLIYMLEEKAVEKGGKVHFINGNHEIMNLTGNVSYANEKYIEVAKQISNEQDWDRASRFLYSKNSEIGKWLRTKNVIERIGRYIFVHGGLNKKLIDQNIDLSEINRISKKYYGTSFEKRPVNTSENIITHPYYSPYWDRSLSMGLLYKTMFFFSDPLNAPMHKPSESELDEILNFYKVDKIVIGHSVVSNVSSDYHNKVIKIDVRHGKEKNSTKTQGLLIENGIEYKIDGLGKSEKL